MDLRNLQGSSGEDTTTTVLPAQTCAVIAHPDVPVPYLVPGEIVGEVYRVVDMIGQGGMGVVYRVEQIYLRQHYALKTLNSRYSDNALMRFQKEAQAASTLRHPNVVSADNFGLLENGLPYLVMDLALGDTLGQFLQRTGPLSPAQMLEIVIPVCSALAYAHEKGVVHRDIKPNNIVITKTNSGELVPKIVDFGIARLTDERDSGMTDLTRTGEVFGTPYYMSPEQCMGQSVDRRGDIYALGCVIFEMLTGAPPFYGSAPLVVMMKHQVEDPPTLKQGSFGRTFPPELEEVVRTALAKKLDERYQSCFELETDLQEILTSGKFGLVRKHRRKPRHKSWLFHLSWIWPTVTLLVCGALIAYLMAPSETERHGPISKPDSISNEVGVDSMFSAATKRQYFSKIVGEGEQARRVFDFGSRPVGQIGVLPADPAKGITWRSAIGLCSFPASAPICFRLDSQSLINNHADLLRGFRQDDLYQLLVHDQPETRMYSDRLDDRVFDEALVFGSHLKSLQDLSLRETPVTVDGLRNIHIDELPKLRLLNLTKTAIDPADLAHLKVIHRLEQICLSFLPNASPVLKAIRNSKNIKNLQLRATGLKDADLNYLTTMSNLEWVNLMDNRGITDKGLAKLTAMPRLEILELSGTSVTPASMSTLLKMKALSKLSLPTETWTRDQAAALHEKMPNCALVVQSGPKH